MFQPIVDTAGGIRRIGYEALIRGRTLFGLCGPKEVFERASEFGGSMTLDQRILELEVKEGLPLLDPTHQRLFLNLPTQTSSEYSWRNHLSKVRNLVLEVSECAQLNDEEMEWLLDFKKNGIELAIDDFGVGQTNLQMLSTLRPEYIKLDLSFVRRGDYETIRRIRRFAEDWGSKLIVEGVETEVEARAVMDAGVRYIQGFRYGKPLEMSNWELGHKEKTQILS